MWDLSSPTRDGTHAPPQWKCGVLTNGLPGKSLKNNFCRSVCNVRARYGWMSNAGRGESSNHGCVCVWKNGGEEESSEGKKATGRKTRKRKTKNKSWFESKISKLNWIRKKKSMKNIEAVAVKIQQVEKVKTGAGIKQKSSPLYR